MVDPRGGLDPIVDVAAATARVVAGYLQRHPLAPADTVRLCQAIGTTFLALATGGDTAPASERTGSGPTPIVDPRRSVFSKYVICLHCGVHLRTLFKHLAVAHGQNDTTYRATFGLPDAYPLACATVRIGRPAGHHRMSRS